jgi:hypothetical protein
MPRADIEVDLPPGWRIVDSAPDQPLCLSPDDGDSTLQLSSPSWAPRLRDCKDLVECEPVLRQIVEGGKLGTVERFGQTRTSYGRVLLAQISTRDPDETSLAWLIVPALDDVLLVTWIACGQQHNPAAHKIVEGIRRSLLAATIASAVDLARRSLVADELASHAVLVEPVDGMITTLPLDQLPMQLWLDACRHERARVNASVVVQVLPAELKGGVPAAIIYGESQARHRKLIVSATTSQELADEDRVEFWAPADPDVAGALDAARG